MDTEKEKERERERERKEISKTCTNILLMNISRHDHEAWIGHGL